MIKPLIKYVKNILFNFKYRWTFRRVNNTHQQLLENIKDIYKENGYVYVYFIVNSLQAWKSSSLYWGMAKEQTFKPIIVIVPSTVDAGKSATSLYDKFKRENYTVIKAFDENQKPTSINHTFKLGIYFYGDPYGNMEKIHFEEVINSNLSCYIPYFFMATNHVGGLTLIPNTTALNNMWRLYMPHQEISHIFSKWSARKGANIKTVGYPAVENLYQKIKKNNTWKVTNKKKKIIYAPHHSIGWGKNSLATFLQFGALLQELAIKYSDTVQWAFKPHPMLKSRLYETPGWGKEKTDTYYNFWKKNTYTQLNEGEYDSLFLNSDAIIHDCSSFIVEYAFTNNPSLYLLNNNNLKGLLNEFGEGVMQTYQQAKTKDEICSFIEDVISGTISFNTNKRSYFNDYVSKYYKEKLPSERIIEDIKQSLGALSVH